MKYLRLFEDKGYEIIDGMLVVKGLHYKDDLDLRGTNITMLPDNLTVRGYLDLRFSKINSLPDGLTVGTIFYLYDTPLVHRYSEEDIRDKCNIGNNIYPKKLDGSEEKYQQWKLEQEVNKYNI